MSSCLNTHVLQIAPECSPVRARRGVQVLHRLQRTKMIHYWQTKANACHYRGSFFFLLQWNMTGGGLYVQWFCVVSVRLWGTHPALLSRQQWEQRAAVHLSHQQFRHTVEKHNKRHSNMWKYDTSIIWRTRQHNGGFISAINMVISYFDLQDFSCDFKTDRRL